MMLLLSESNVITLIAGLFFRQKTSSCDHVYRNMITLKDEFFFNTNTCERLALKAIPGIEGIF